MVPDYELEVIRKPIANIL